MQNQTAALYCPPVPPSLLPDRVRQMLRYNYLLQSLEFLPPCLDLCKVSWLHPLPLSSPLASPVSSLASHGTCRPPSPSLRWGPPARRLSGPQPSVFRRFYPESIGNFFAKISLQETVVLVCFVRFRLAHVAPLVITRQDGILL